MPLVDEKNTQNTAQTISDRKQRRASRLSGDKPEKSDATEVEIIPVSAARMANEPERVTIGALSLSLVAPTVRKAHALQQKIYQVFPDSLIFAVTGDMRGTGIDPDAVQRVMEGARRFQYETLAANLAANSEAQEAMPPYEPVTPAEVDALMQSLNEELVTSAEEIAHCVQEMLLPGETIRADDLLDNLATADFADLLRVMLHRMGGYPGDCRDRFRSGGIG